MKRISRVTIGAAAIAAAILLANSWHVLSLWRGPLGTVPMGIAHYFADYFLYLSLIVQGSQGAWGMTRHLFTNESLDPAWIYWFYTLLGKAGYTGIPPAVIYNAALIGCAGALLWLLWRLSGRVFPKLPAIRLTGYVLLLTASHVPGPGDFWFSPAPALNRLGGVPHQIFQTVLLLSVILMADRLLDPGSPQQKRRAGSALLAAASFLAAAANPVQMLLVTGAAGVAILTAKRNAAETFLFSALIGLPALAGAVLTNMAFANDPVLTAAKIWEDAQSVTVGVKTFLFALGPAALFIPFGIRPFLRHLSPVRIMILTLGILSFGMFFSPVPALLGTSPVRWLSPVSYALIPLVAAQGIAFLADRLRAFTGTGMPRATLTGAVVALYLAATLPSLAAQVSARTTPLQTDPTLIRLNHVPEPVMRLIMTLSRLPDGTVVTDPSLPYDVLVPLTGRKSFTGHPIHTLYPSVKEDLRRRYFEGAMTDTERRRFYADHGIRYVLASAAAGRVLPTSGLETLGATDSVLLFRVHETP